MGKYAYLQGSGSSPQVGARMSSYAWLGVVLAVRAGRVDHPASPPTSQHGTLGDRQRSRRRAWLAESLRRRAARREARAIAPLIITRPAAAILVVLFVVDRIVSRNSRPHNCGGGNSKGE